MAVLYVTHFRDQLSGGQQVARNMLSSQQESITGSSTQTATFPEKTKYVMIAADIACLVAIGTNPTASASDGLYLPAGVLVPLGVPDGHDPTTIMLAVKTP